MALSSVSETRRSMTRKPMRGKPARDGVHYIAPPSPSASATGRRASPHFEGLPPCSDLTIASTMSSEQDLRHSTRRPLRCPVTLRLGDMEYHGETVDISAGGVLLRIQCPLANGDCVHYTIDLPGDVFGMSIPVKVNCHGRVVRCSPAPGQAGQDVAIVTDDYFFGRSRECSVLKTG